MTDANSCLSASNPSPEAAQGCRGQLPFPATPLVSSEGLQLTGCTEQEQGSARKAALPGAQGSSAQPEPGSQHALLGKERGSLCHGEPQHGEGAQTVHEGATAQRADTRSH